MFNLPGNEIPVNCVTILDILTYSDLGEMGVPPCVNL